jgi:SAM-dependent methyltransferase
MNAADVWSEPTAYERWYLSSLGKAYRESLGRVLGPWLASCPAKRALDIGCGPGWVLEPLFPPAVEVWAVDCSRQMAARAELSRGRTGRPVHIAVGSVERLPFGDARFDAALCVNCLEFVRDRDAAFAEIARVLAPAGAAFLGVLNRRSVWEWTRRLRRPFSRQPYYRGRFFAESELRRHCAEVGLRVEEIRYAVHFPPIPPGPLAPLYEKRDRARQRAPSGALVLCKAVNEPREGG